MCSLLILLNILLQSYLFIYRNISFEIKTFHRSINTVMIQIKTVQTFSTVQVLNVNKKQKDTNISLYILLQADFHPDSQFSGRGRSVTRSTWYVACLVMGKCCVSL